MAGDTPNIQLRQIALVTRDMDRVSADMCDVFHINIAFHDPALHTLGLHNSLMAIGNQFIEVVAPLKENTSAERYLNRRGGDTGYMLIFQTTDHDKHKKLVEQSGVRIVAQFNSPGFHNMQLHPADTGGLFIEIDQQDGVDQWHPAGPHWHNTVDTSWVSAITGANVACHDPEHTASRWGQLLDVPVTIGANCGRHKIRVGTSSIRFIPVGDRGEGLESIELSTTHRKNIIQRAHARSLPHDDNGVFIGGVWCVLNDA